MSSISGGGQQGQQSKIKPLDVAAFSPNVPTLHTSPSMFGRHDTDCMFVDN